MQPDFIIERQQGLDGHHHFIARDNTGNAVGGITVALDGSVVYCGNLWCQEAPPGTALSLIREAARFSSQNGAHGCIVYTSGKNRNRPLYRRLGFRDIYGVDGGLSAPLPEILNALEALPGGKTRERSR